MLIINHKRNQHFSLKNDRVLFEKIEYLNLRYMSNIEMGRDARIPAFRVSDDVRFKYTD